MPSIKNLPATLKKHAPAIATVSTITTIAVIAVCTHKYYDRTFLEVTDQNWKLLMEGGGLVYSPAGIELIVTTVKK
jgi:hypothetical protein